MNAILSILKDHKEELFTNYPIKSLALFGSYSRGDNKKNSDIDIMVEMAEPKAFAFLDLADKLEKILKKKVDLVSRGGVKEQYFKYLQKDLQYV
ncbi:MAG: nucleotidyltransferase family protein [Ferruginibacter sp.]